jgi:hypothetical protein
MMTLVSIASSKRNFSHWQSDGGHVTDASPRRLRETRRSTIIGSREIDAVDQSTLLSLSNFPKKPFYSEALADKALLRCIEISVIQLRTARRLDCEGIG